jgi:sec-independent protein translocase protein TatC
VAPFKRRPARAPGGTMTLVEHLTELRDRLFRSVLAIAVATVAGWFLYPQVLDLLTRPYETGIAPLLREQGLDATLAITGVGGALQFQLKISVIVGLVISSPVWFWQIWAFVLPAMHKHEKKWAVLLTGTGVPLFLAGVGVGYLVLPKGIEVLLGFVPEGWESILTAADYLDFVTRMLLVFGLAAEIPLVVILLNRIGAVSHRTLVRARPWIVIGIFVFAAVATPTTDPVTMIFLAAPMTVLYFIAEVITLFTDRRRGRESADWADDEASPL